MLNIKYQQHLKHFSNIIDQVRLHFHALYYRWLYILIASNQNKTASCRSPYPNRWHSNPWWPRTIRRIICNACIDATIVYDLNTLYVQWAKVPFLRHDSIDILRLRFMLCRVWLWFSNGRFYPYSSYLLHWHWGNHTIAPVSEKKIWRIWVNASCESLDMRYEERITTKQRTTKPCAYHIRRTVYGKIGCFDVWKILYSTNPVAINYRILFTYLFLSMFYVIESAFMSVRISM